MNKFCVCFPILANTKMTKMIKLLLHIINMKWVLYVIINGVLHVLMKSTECNAHLNFFIGFKIYAIYTNMNKQIQNTKNINTHKYIQIYSHNIYFLSNIKQVISEDNCMKKVWNWYQSDSFFYFWHDCKL